ncbi:hypothetical protein GCM10009548_88450 [Streptomyces malaysiensis subsp. malaysiensis]
MLMPMAASIGIRCGQEFGIRIRHRDLIAAQKQNEHIRNSARSIAPFDGIVDTTVDNDGRE